MSTWEPSSWRKRPANQQPTYPDQDRLGAAIRELGGLPPLVTSWEVERLKSQLAEAAEGRRFLLQGGACAERFDQCSADIITNKLKVLLQMSLVLTYGLKRRIIRVGRFAGQYAKPRSSDTETRDGITLPSYRGDLVNGPGFTEDERIPDPDRLVRGYEISSLTLNFIRSLVEGGFADLRHPEYWDLDFVEHSPRAAEYQRMVESISDSIRFMEVLADSRSEEISRVDFFTSHEGLHLPYEQAVTRRVPRRDGWYNLGTHLPWLGMRTCELDGAHVEYYRGIRNPIGLKVGPAMTGDWLSELIEVLDPDDEPGRLTLIHRFGVDRVADCLPPLIEAAKACGRRVVWCSDPMHGNTEKTADGIKTRRFDNILGEVEQAFDIHHEMGSYLGGIHFELSGDNVTECIGGARGLGEADLRRAYESRVDPRLNYEQSLEMALLIAEKMAKMNGTSA
ncbi:MAG: 3-deoxy-7-phosphoheptulonate synthase class II [Thermoanaerobaculales bacterium]|jgi:3-deoxy-7-phosphoheptulonate synthase|nr:3-deoxy-7-phosphoheptulonate synthase class II [Thermoanaerobaculales bacterium]